MRNTVLDPVAVTVELFGQARLACGAREVVVRVPTTAPVSAIVEALSKACPELVGTALRADRASLMESYTFNLNGTTFVDSKELRLAPGDVILLFSSQAGG